MPELALDAWLQKQATLTLERILPTLTEPLATMADAPSFVARLREHFPRIFTELYALYGTHYDFHFHVERILHSAATYHALRSPILLQRDQARQADPTWLLSENMIGMTLYVDLFAGTFEGVREKIPYLQELGITYLHLMPLFKCPEENSDGGYAVSSYRETHPMLGTIEDLATLAQELHVAGINLVVDFIFNHTSDEHEWALKAKAGDETYRDYYRIFPDRTLPDQYQRTLREIFPETAPGAFTWIPEVQGWVWTTFYPFQWDLNYDNPQVFASMMGEMLFLANVGVDVLRLDAVAFVWKQMGTGSENLPQAHQIIRALNAIAQVVAPSLVFKSEAIVHPDDVYSYIDFDECPISYNPTMMAMIWDALATRKPNVLSYAMKNRFALPQNCAWVNYIRVHDDIGWSMADGDLAVFGMNGYDHRQFLNRYYSGKFPGSFAKGLPFNYNPQNQDMRICGTAASLAGLEQALEVKSDILYQFAIERILLIHSIILSTGGIPLIYSGDEIATLNDYGYLEDPHRQQDSRWAHRSVFDWQRAENRYDLNTTEGRVFSRLARMIAVRKAHAAFGGNDTRFIPCENEHVLVYLRPHAQQPILCVANFSEHLCAFSLESIRAHWQAPFELRDLLTDKALRLGDEVQLAPYQFMWLG